MSSGSLPASILLVDDNASELEALAKILSRAGYSLELAEDGEKGLDLFRKRPVDLVIADLQMPKMGGEELLKITKTLRPDTEVILITGHGTVESAVESIKRGAYDFIEKPIRKYHLLKTVEKALERQNLARKNEELTGLVQKYEAASVLIGRSPNFLKSVEMAGQVAVSEATVLIQGESGTGKELFADYIQKRSLRKDSPFIKLNCAAIPETLLESELFGYEKGAFTGAVSNKPGKFELGSTGTLFLDEVGDMSLAIQAKLLRVIENGEFQHIGGTRTLKADVRMIAATHADLNAKVKEKTFREDLYYRLNVVQIVIPPLRERRSDIPLLAAHFLRTYSQKNGKTIRGFKEEALSLLENYVWPGNVRELENVIERAVVLSKGAEISGEDLPPALLADSSSVRPGYITLALGTPLGELEQRLIDETLKYTKGDKESAAKLLGTSSRTIYRKLKNPSDTLSTL